MHWTRICMTILTYCTLSCNSCNRSLSASTNDWLLSHLLLRNLSSGQCHRQAFQLITGQCWDYPSGSSSKKRFTVALIAKGQNAKARSLCSPGAKYAARCHECTYCAVKLILVHLRPSGFCFVSCKRRCCMMFYVNGDTWNSPWLCLGGTEATQLWPRGLTLLFPMAQWPLYGVLITYLPLWLISRKQSWGLSK